MMDPYQTLGVPHSASPSQIKRAYHSSARKWHPDKYVLETDTAVKERAASRFAACAAAYSLLTDPQRKSQYDHVYKYGGYDEAEPELQSTARNQVRDVGIGYTCFDPCAFLFTQGKVHARRTVAGIQIPSRNVTGLRFAFTNSNVAKTPSGTTKCTSKTVQFAQGRRSTKTETVTYFPDGRKEVIIEDGDNNRQQKFSTYHNVQQQESPWYINAYEQLRDKMACGGCAAVAQ